MPSLLTDRKLLACGTCRWVHYAMTAEEKAAQDDVLSGYELSRDEREVYESQFRQCLRCESPASGFRLATEADIGRALGHIVTPVLAPHTAAL
jgi:hypothetical protein